MEQEIGSLVWYNNPETLWRSAIDIKAVPNFCSRTEVELDDNDDNFETSVHKSEQVSRNKHRCENLSVHLWEDLVVHLTKYESR